MTGVRDITQLCFSSNLAGIMVIKNEQSCYPVYSYSGIESNKHALSILSKLINYAEAQFSVKPFLYIVRHVRNN